MPRIIYLKMGAVEKFKNKIQDYKYLKHHTLENNCPYIIFVNYLRTNPRTYDFKEQIINNRKLKICY